MILKLVKTWTDTDYQYDVAITADNITKGAVTLHHLANADIEVELYVLKLNSRA